MSQVSFEKGLPFSDDELERLEGLVDWTLPPDYRSFAKVYGGAFVGGEVDGNSSLPVLSFGTFDQAWRTSADGSVLPDNFPISFARCELGNLWVFDRSGAVHYINFYSRPAVAVFVATNFSEFLGRILISGE
ncbi:SMI1/KNR4 family protein [Sphingomonas suaedae]|uniref:SMI1/KNR4 family protein n=1 Tax=Sphingomonas suaedae TaxID=2599297 RepID=A0A518RCN5_9SPHN|nr:SMI1/KNR4 family protein [Sphingomonas suaedae]QDX25228.1 SMI1/KNR4 family protein [Sphingomonas suaedae]